MPLPASADQVVIQGYLFDEDGGGLQAPVTAAPVPLAGQSAAPLLLNPVAHAHIQTKSRTATPDAATGYWAILALATNDPDLDGYGGRAVTLPGQPPRTVEVPYTAPQQTVTTAMAAQINPGGSAGLPKVGDTVRVAWFHELGSYTAPTPAAAYYTSGQTASAIATGVDAHNISISAHTAIRERAALGSLYSVDARRPPPGQTAITADGATNDGPALQALMNWVKATYGGGRVFASRPGAGIKLSTGITIPARVQLVSDETTVFDCTGIGSGTAVTVNDNDFTPMVGVRLEGPNFVPANTPGDASTGVSVTGHGLAFDSCHLKFFGRGLDLAHNNTYIVAWRGGSVGVCGTGIYNDIEAAGVGNAGERIVFTGSTIYNCSRGFNAAAGGCSMFFTNCSIDFCAEFGRVSNAFVYFTGCHLETGGSGAGPYLVEAVGNAHTFYSNCDLIMGGGRSGGLYHVQRFDRGPANYGFGSARLTNCVAYFVDPAGTSKTRFSEEMIPWENGVTTKNLYVPWPLRWLSTSAEFVATDGAVPPNADTVRVTAMDVATGQITLTSSAAFAGQRWVRIRFS